ncbi:MAG: XrtA-associated tyrosine autokinase [Methylococcaceae bacterium]|nr:XrtA-associated tyrosine autokinase [Methylococcaceae bacterium]
MSIIEKALEKRVVSASDGRSDTTAFTETDPVSQFETGFGPGPETYATASEEAIENVLHKTHTLEEISGFRDNVSKTCKINSELLRAKGMLLPESGPKQMVEEYRQIKRPLLMNAFPEGENGIKRSNLILVTSSLPGEGKTFTAINLAISIASEREKTVLLVDADVAKPSISKFLGIESEKGLTDMLEDPSVRFSDVLIRTDIPKFTLLPAGRQHEYSTELLASDAMRRLTDEMSRRYADRIVIFDSPPLMAATQGGVLADLVGQVIMVIESEVTPQYMVREAIGKLSKCEVVGCVLNKTKMGIGLNYYAYGNYGR